MPTRPSSVFVPAIPARLQGVVLMCLSMLCFAMMNNCVRFVSQSVPTEQVVLLRNVVALVLLSIWLACQKAPMVQLRTGRLASHLGRATLGVVSMHTWFYALGHMNLNQATALSFTTPIFVSILAIVFLKEQSNRIRWVAIGLGLVGAMIIVRPSTHGMNPVAGLAILSSMLIAIISLWVKSLSRTETTSAMLFYMALFMAIFSLPMGLLHWQPMSFSVSMAALVLAVMSLLAHSFLIEAYKHSEMTALMPFDFTRLIFTAMIAYVWFREPMDHATWAGSALIVAASLLAARYGTRPAAKPLA